MLRITNADTATRPPAAFSRLGFAGRLRLVPSIRRRVDPCSPVDPVDHPAGRSLRAPRPARRADRPATRYRPDNADGTALGGVGRLGDGSAGRCGPGVGSVLTAGLSRSHRSNIQRKTYIDLLSLYPNTPCMRKNTMGIIHYRINRLKCMIPVVYFQKGED
jgi:hypothetical protein